MVCKQLGKGWIQTIKVRRKQTGTKGIQTRYALPPKSGTAHSGSELSLPSDMHLSTYKESGKFKIYSRELLEQISQNS